jgi:hypothetical protein
MIIFYISIFRQKEYLYSTPNRVQLVALDKIYHYNIVS